MARWIFLPYIRRKVINKGGFLNVQKRICPDISGKQGQLFDEPVADDFEEAEAFLEDCMAVVLDSLKDVKKYLDGMGADVEGLSLKELEEESEVFKLPDGKYMIVEG